MHPDNRHNNGYDLQKLATSYAPLQPFLQKRKEGQLTIDFSDPKAVRALNTALLQVDYKLRYWDLLEDYLCPAVPGRADYILHIKDYWLSHNRSKKPVSSVRMIDLGCGANLIYTILAVQLFDWKVTAIDTDPAAINHAKKIATRNKWSKDQVEIIHQINSQQFLKGAIDLSQNYDILVCNPPFYSTLQAYQKANTRKNKSLHGKDSKKEKMNFKGIENELIYPGGESRFIRNLIRESKQLKSNVQIYSCLVSNKKLIPTLLDQLQQLKARSLDTIEMATGNKKMHILVWQF